MVHDLPTTRKTLPQSYYISSALRSVNNNLQYLCPLYASKLQHFLDYNASLWTGNAEVEPFQRTSIDDSSTVNSFPSLSIGSQERYSTLSAIGTIQVLSALRKHAVESEYWRCITFNQDPSKQLLQQMSRKHNGREGEEESLSHHQALRRLAAYRVFHVLG